MRRLIVCSDGTWNRPDQKFDGVLAPTNVVKMARAISPRASDQTPQIVFYDAGVGTDNILARVAGLAGIGFNKNVRDAYRFLIHNYADGDEIYFFGFSRGAYTVRSAAGLIRNCGLLRKGNAERIPEAFKIYRRRDESADTDKAKKFRQNYSYHPVRIKFIGVWDTVGALGIPSNLFHFIGRGRYDFHDLSLSRSVDYAYQSVAIDEKRTFYRPALWEQNPKAANQVLEQAWFAGVHMDVGGGYSTGGLADCAFLWVKQKAEAVGLAFDPAYIQALRPDPLWELHRSRTFPFNLIPSYSRPIATAVRSRESVHAGARQRYDEVASYRPENLVTYLRREQSS